VKMSDPAVVPAGEKRPGGWRVVPMHESTVDR